MESASRSSLAKLLTRKMRPFLLSVRATQTVNATLIAR